MSSATLELPCMFFILRRFSGFAFFLFSSTGIKKWLPSNTKTVGTKCGLNSEPTVANLATLALSINASTDGGMLKAVSIVWSSQIYLFLIKHSCNKSHVKIL